MRALLRKRRPPLSRWASLSLAHAATIGSRRRAELFSHVHTFSLFIGFSRSGHSLPAALLDAHPRIVMAHELGALRLARARLGRNQLYELLAQNTRVRGHSAGRGGGHTYHVEGGWQGRCDRIEVIGDKHGEFSAQYLRRFPFVLSRLRTTVGVRLRFIHVVRNPYDNIASRAIRQAERTNTEPSRTLDEAIDRHRDNCAAVGSALARFEREEVIESRHETFLQTPQGELTRICRRLGVEADSDYLDACRRVVKTSANPTRFKLSWSERQLDQVRQLIDYYPFLSGYRFNG